MKFLLAIVVFFLFASCEKDITIKTENPEQLLVVEGQIEVGEYPFVILTKSQNYYSKITPSILANSFVKNAIVDVSNGTTTTRLKEYTFPVNQQYSVSIYTVDFANLTNTFTGEVGKTYTLTISADGKNYNASTIIPRMSRRIDSLFWKDVPNTTGADTVWKQLWLKDHELIGRGDQVRVEIQRNNDGYLPYTPGSVFDDEVIDGKTFTILIERPWDRNATSNPDGAFRNYFKRGDTVDIKISNIDRPTYDFWRTLEYNYSTVGNPFANAVKVLSNIKGAPALGYFGGFNPLVRRIIIR